MINKKRIIAIVIFLLLSFFMMTFGEPAANSPVATRDVTFVDSYDNTELAKKKVELGGKVETPKVPNHKNVVFMYWCYEKTENKADLDRIMNDMNVETCYADDINNNNVPDEKDPRYTVTFINNRTNEVLKSQSVLVGMNATAPKVPTYNGYTFDGWTKPYTNVKNDVTTKTIYNSNEIVVEKFNVTFVDGDNKEVIATVKVEKGASATTPKVPKHEKRIFDYWQGNYSNVSKDEIVTAIYTADINENEIKDYEEYIHIRYDLNGGKSEVLIEDKKDYLPNFDNVIITSLKPTKAEAKFMGWSLIKYNILQSKEDETAVVFINNPFKITKNTTIYAVWAIDDNENEIKDYEEYYKIRYISECSTEIVIQKVLYKSKIQNVVNTFVAGFTNGGWYKDANFTKNWNFEKDLIIEDTTIYGKCIAIDYKITYNLNEINVEGASHSNTKTNYKVTDENYTLKAATSISHNFAGWYVGGTPYTVLASGSTGDIAFTAYWSIKEYKVTFCKSDSTCEQIDVNHGNDIIAPAEEVKTGYTCVWNPNVSLTNVTSNLEVNSICNKNKYTLTVNPNGGIYNNVATNTIYENVEFESTKDIVVPTKTGYTFVNWTIEGTGTTIEGNTLTMGSSNATITANWIINSYTITFDTKGGSEIQPIVKNYGETVTVPVNPTKTGYTFNGWDKVIPTTMPAENMTIIANWTINSYTITFDTKGGSEIQPIVKNYGEAVTVPVNPTKTGYTFNGWDKLIPTTMPAENMIITADWTINKYTLTVNPNGGTYNSVATNTIYENVEYASTKTIAGPTRLGYTFTNWSLVGTNSTINDQLFTMGSVDATLTANWQENSYNITYLLNNNDLVNGKINNSKVSYKVTDPIYTLTPASSDSHSFVGWYTEANGGTKVTTLAGGTVGNVVLFANWVINSNDVIYKDKTTTIATIPVEYGEDISINDIPEIPSHPGYTCNWNPATVTNVIAPVIVNLECTINNYNVTYNLNDTGITGGLHSNSLVTYNILTTTYTLLPASSLSHNFDGWYTEANGGTKVTTLAGGTVGNVVLFAHWTANLYTITFNSNGGSAVSPYTNVLYNKLISAPTNPTKAGYNFNGWFKEESLKNNWNFMTDSVKASLTLYAKWIEEVYNLTFVMNDDGITNSVVPTNETTYTISSEFNFNNAKSDSHDFNGWYTEVNGGTKVIGIVPGTIGNKTLYGHWTIKNYNIKFIDTDNTETNKNVTWGSNLTDIPVVTPVPGYDCSWDRIDFTNITANDTVNAVCELATFTLMVDPNTGFWIGTTPQNIKYTKTSTINDPTKVGYEFTGWTLVGSNSTINNKTFTMGTENAKLTANWAINKYTLTVNPNGGTYNSVTTNTIYENVEYASTKTIANPTRAGYDFAGWTLTGVDSTINNQIFTMGTTNALLEAKWSPSTNTVYTVEHYFADLTGNYPETPGTGNIETKYGTTGQLTTATAKNVDGFEALSFSQALIAANGNTIVKIYYNRSSYTITLISGLNIASVIGGGTYKYGSQVNIDAVLNSSNGYNYTFNKWSSNNTVLLADQTTKNASFTMPAGNITLTASATKSEIVPNVEIGSFTANYPLNGKEAEPGDSVNYSLTINNNDNYAVPVKLNLTSDGILESTFIVTYKNSNGETISTANVTNLNNLIVPIGGSIVVQFTSKVSNNQAVNSMFNLVAKISTLNDTLIDSKTKGIQVQKSANVVTENSADKNVLLILDLSGSMDDRINGVKKITSLKLAAKKFKNQLLTDANSNNSDITLTVIGIGNKQGMMYGSPTDKMDNWTYAYIIGTYSKNSWITDSKIDDLYADGGTNITGALSIAKNIISSSTYRSTYNLNYLTDNAEEFVVLLSDGANGPSGDIRIENTNPSAVYLRNNSSLFAIGFGSAVTNVNSDGYKDLLAITNNSNLIYKADDDSSLSNAFASIATKIGQQQSVNGKITVNLPTSGLYYPITFSYMNGTIKTQLFKISKAVDLNLYPEVTIADNKLYWNISGTTYSNKAGLKVELDLSSAATNGQ